MGRSAAGDPVSQQLLFEVYCYVVVGFLGNALIGWEVGKKGWLGVGLEGARNKRIVFALSSFIVMLVWQRAGKMQPLFTSWRDAWGPAVGLAFFLLSRSLTPKSQRLYNRAKMLHETTFFGDWLHGRSPELIQACQNNPRLREAESLYIASLHRQETLASKAPTDVEKYSHLENAASAYCQLALLYGQQSFFEKAEEAGSKAVEIAEQLSQNVPGNKGFLRVLSLSLFRLAQVEHARLRRDRAKCHYERSLAIDKQLGLWEDAAVTEKQLQALLGQYSSKEVQG